MDLPGRILVIGALLLGDLDTAAAQGVGLRVLAQESLPPKWIAHDSGMRGVCPDILAALEKVEPRLRFGGHQVGRSVPAIEQGLASGQVDAACALLETPQRLRIAQIVGKPLYTVRHRLAAAAGDGVVVNNLADLIKLNALINTSRGAGYVGQLQALGLQVDDTSGDNLLNLKKVLAGHGRFTYMNEMTLAWIIHAEGLQTRIRVLPVVLKEEPIYFWMSRKCAPASVELVERALARLSASGELNRIYERWVNLKTVQAGLP